MSPRRTIPDRDRLIARIPADTANDRRRKVLDQVVHDTRHGSTVYVERSWRRNVDEIDDAVVCRILGLAWVPGGATSLALVVDPVDTGKRMIAIPVSQLVRIRWAYSETGSTDPTDYDLGLVIAGPPL